MSGTVHSLQQHFLMSSYVKSLMRELAQAVSCRVWLRWTKHWPLSTQQDRAWVQKTLLHILLVRVADPPPGLLQFLKWKWLANVVLLLFSMFWWLALQCCLLPDFLVQPSILSSTFHSFRSSSIFTEWGNFAQLDFGCREHFQHVSTHLLLSCTSRGNFRVLHLMPFWALQAQGWTLTSHSCSLCTQTWTLHFQDHSSQRLSTSSTHR